MVKVCSCWGCTNSSYSGHRVHRFPNQKNPAFRAWVRFVGVKRQDFTTSSVTNNSVICGAHFREEDYIEGDLTEHKMGFKNKTKIRLKSSAVPSIHRKGNEGKERHGLGAVAPAATTMAAPSSSRRNSGAKRRTAAHKLEVSRMITEVLSQVETTERFPEATGSPEIQDVLQMVLVKEEPPDEQSAGVDQQDPDHLHIKEEQEGFWTSLEGEQLHLKEEEGTDAASFPFTTVSIKNVQQMLLFKEEPPEEQRTSKDQQDPDHLHIKEEQEELWTSLEGEQLPLKEEETDASRFPFTTVSIKSEDDEEKLFSHLHQQQIKDKYVPTSSSADQMTAETDGGAESSKNPDLNHHQQTTDSETEVSEDDEDDVTLESFSCDDCGQIFRHETNLNSHMRVHTREKPFACELCGKRFSQKTSLNRHMRLHTGQPPFASELCGQRFRYKTTLNTHMGVHTG